MIGGKPLRPPRPRRLPWDITFSPASRSVVIFPTGRTAALPLICLLLRNCLSQKRTHYTLRFCPSLLSESKVPEQQDLGLSCSLFKPRCLEQCPAQSRCSGTECGMRGWLVGRVRGG